MRSCQFKQSLERSRFAWLDEAFKFKLPASFFFFLKKLLLKRHRHSKFNTIHNLNYVPSCCLSKCANHIGYLSTIHADETVAINSFPSSHNIKQCLCEAKLSLSCVSFKPNTIAKKQATPKLGARFAQALPEDTQEKMASHEM